jgi:phospholipid transport system substrate-binding protein
MLKSVAALLLFLSLALAGPAQAAAVDPATEPSPMKALKAAVDEVLAIMMDKTITGEGAAKKKLDKAWVIINRYFADAEMARRTLGVHWPKIKPEEQKEFTHLYSELLRRSYLSRLALFEGQEILYDKEVIEGEYAKVDSHFDYHGERIPLGYSLIKQGGGWKVYDMVIDNMSLIANYRRQFNQIISKDGYAGLVKRLQAKLTEEETLEKKD